MLTALAEACGRGAEDRARQPAGRGGVAAHDRPARVRRRWRPSASDADRHAERPAAHRRRPRAPARRRQGRPRGRPRATPTRSTARSSRRTRPGFEEYRAARAPATPWDGARAAVRRRRADDPRGRRGSTRRRARTVVSWCLGVTQQEHGVDTVREIVNLLLLRGNVGRAGRRARRRSAGTRTSRATAPAASTTGRSQEFLDRLAEVCGIDSPRDARARHGAHDRGHAARRGEGLRRHGRQLRARRARHGADDRGAAPLRADRAGQHEAEPQPPRPRQAGADPAVPRPQPRRTTSAAASRPSRSRTR